MGRAAFSGQLPKLPLTLLCKVLQKLYGVFNVSEEVFTQLNVSENSRIYGKLPEVTGMILEEVQTLPEDEQLRWLADLKESKAKG